MNQVKSDELLFIIRLFPEISIKSPPVRKRWTKLLCENIRTIMRRIHPKASVIRDWDRLDVRIPSNGAIHRKSVVECLGCIPGIAHYSEVVPHYFESMHDIYEIVYEAWKIELENKTFCVRVKRSGNHDFSSTELERYVGGGLNQNVNTRGVKLKDPEVTVVIEVKDNRFFLVHSRYPGLGGFPVGTQEPVLSLVSGGFDSTVASFMMMKRGLRTHFCFFNLGGKAHELGVKEIAFFLWNKYASSHRVRFITVPFEGVVNEILDKVGPSNMGVVLKRMMLRAAERVSEKGGIQALVTGEAISQVSSQTIPNLKIIDKVTDMLVLRPLITTDKLDIIDVARQIGAEEFSANIPEYCGVISVKPSAKVNEMDLLEQETNMDMAVLDQALAKVSVQFIDEVMNNIEAPQEVDVVKAPSKAHIVIDIRHPDELETKPLKIEQAKVLEIPFYQLNKKFSELAAQHQYLLYCEKGVMSELHAAFLKDEGHNNVGVFRPSKE